MVSEAGHGEGPGEELHTLAQLCHAGHALRVLQQKGLEAGQVPFQRREEPRPQVSVSNSMVFIVLVKVNKTNTHFGLTFEPKTPLITMVFNLSSLIFYSFALKSEAYSSFSLTRLLLHIQCDLNPFINKLHNLFKVCFLELSGCQSRSP